MSAGVSAIIIALTLAIFVMSQTEPVVSFYQETASAATPAVYNQAAKPTMEAVKKDTPKEGLLVVHRPRIGVAKIREILQKYGSPAVGEAQAFYDLGEKYGLDPAVCLAFYVLESTAGTKGVARTTKSIGNIRARWDANNKRFIDPEYQGFRRYNTYREGIEHWYRLITELYVGEWGRDTVETILDKYAPLSENDTEGYKRFVLSLVEEWTNDNNESDK